MIRLPPLKLSKIDLPNCSIIPSASVRSGFCCTRFCLHLVWILSNILFAEPLASWRKHDKAAGNDFASVDDIF